ncbi:hypothetical protein P154DRAFT_573972 [Amniculicola lignicola CBS 123094]|uniref:Uncharacterized protein n=1 Tax=Amniculicola lignicola CBS 123094 TaxID=1392246 RepID=A0A6A5WN03_9PLEO|nr:hypothetical protein P154DRAFT_573972 [Amniculicola lignicola CBS 123094]
MSIFSRMKKAKKAAAEHKKVAIQEQKEEIEKPPPVPYKHIPTHAAQDALSAMPTVWGPKETRARIAAARKRMSEVTASAPASVRNSSSTSDMSFTPRPMYRSQSDMSMFSIMRQPQSSHQLRPGKGQQSQSAIPPVPALPHMPSGKRRAKSSNEPAAFVQPRNAPSAPPRRQKPHHSNSSVSSVRRKSPLSNVSLDQAHGQTDDLSSRTSEGSACSSAASTASFVETAPVRKQKPHVGILKLPMPSFVTEKRSPIVEISSPYGVDDEHSRLSSPSIPTWRYEDFVRPTEEPVRLETIPRSFSSGMFHRKPESITGV